MSYVSKLKPWSFEGSVGARVHPRVDSEGMVTPPKLSFYATQSTVSNVIHVTPL